MNKYSRSYGMMRTLLAILCVLLISSLFTGESSHAASILGAVDTPGLARSVSYKDHIAYVADSESGLQVIDVSDPTSPHIIGSVDTPGFAYSVHIEDTYAYVADGDLRIVDVSDPTSPHIEGSLNVS